jgi:large subunit ribosomal protein L2
VPVRVYKPTSAGRRKMSVSDFAEITRSEPEPSLVEGHGKSGGRNHYGRVTSWHRGGGH